MGASSISISIQVDAEIAQAFAAFPEEKQRKIELLLGLRLRELTTRKVRPLGEIMDEIGREAEARGMTPEILDSILKDE